MEQKQSQEPNPQLPVNKSHRFTDILIGAVLSAILGSIFNAVFGLINWKGVWSVILFLGVIVLQVIGVTILVFMMYMGARYPNKVQRLNAFYAILDKLKITHSMTVESASHFESKASERNNSERRKSP